MNVTLLFHDEQLIAVHDPVIEVRDREALLLAIRRSLTIKIRHEWTFLCAFDVATRKVCLSRGEYDSWAPTRAQIDQLMEILVAEELAALRNSSLRK